MDHPGVRRPLAEGDIPTHEHHLLRVAQHHAGHRHREVSDRVSEDEREKRKLNVRLCSHYYRCAKCTAHIEY